MNPGAVVSGMIWLAAGAAALVGLRMTMPDYRAMTGAIIVEAQSGEQASGRDFSARLYRLETAKELRWQGLGGEQSRQTGGVWLLADIEVESHLAPAGLDAVWLGATGRRYLSSRRVQDAPGQLPRAPLQPGLPHRGFAIFELPPDEIDGGRLMLARSLAPMFDTNLSLAPPATAVLAHETFDLAGAAP